MLKVPVLCAVDVGERPRGVDAARGQHPQKRLSRRSLAFGPTRGVETHPGPVWAGGVTRKDIIRHPRVTVQVRWPLIRRGRTAQAAPAARPAPLSWGFTLVELLIVIVILGLLSGGVVFAVGRLASDGAAAACATAHRTLEVAEERHRARFGAYATEAVLVADGQIRGESSRYDISVSASDYTLIATGECAALATSIAGTTTTVAATTSTTPAVTTTPPAPAPTTTTVPFALRLSSLCTPRSHWPNERAWGIHNPNPTSVAFTLDAVKATNHPGHHIADAAPSGDSTWYLPAADRGRNTAVLAAANLQSSLNSRNRKC